LKCHQTHFDDMTELSRVDKALRVSTKLYLSRCPGGRVQDKSCSVRHKNRVNQIG
jgi:hypothetical protein